MKNMHVPVALLPTVLAGGVPYAQALARAMRLTLTAFVPVLLVLALSGGVAQAHKVNIFATVEAGSITGEGYFGGGNKAQNTLVEVRDALGGLVGSTRTDGGGSFRLPVPLGARLPLRVVLKAGDGHQNDYPVTAADLGLPPDAEATPLAGTGLPQAGAGTPQAGAAKPLAGAAGGSPEGAGASSSTSAGATSPAPVANTASIAAAAAANTSGSQISGAATVAASTGTLDRSPQGEVLAALVEAAVAKTVEAKIAPLRLEINRLSEINEKAKVRDIVGGLGWIAGLFGLAAVLRGRKK